MTTFEWSTPGTYTTLIAGASSSPTLKNLASDGRKLGTEIDNESGPRLAGIELKVRGASTFSAGGHAQIWFIAALDSTNYEDGDDSTTPARAPDVTIPFRLVSTQQKLFEGPVALPNSKFKALVINKGGQAFTNTDDENVLSFRPWKDEGI